MKAIVDFRVKGPFSPAMMAFFEQCWLELVNNEPSNDFIFISEENADNDANQFSERIMLKTLKTSSFHWLDQKRLVKELTTWNADRYVYFHKNGMYVIKPSGKHISGKDLQQKNHYIVFSGLKKDQPNNFLPVWPGNIPALSWSDGETIKNKYTSGKDFFLVTGDIDTQHRLIELLKSFTGFKKWQQSNMQLVIAGYATSGTERFEELLASYKYRADVVLLKDIEEDEIGKLVAASYAMLYPFNENVPPVALVRAIQTGIAVIASDSISGTPMADAVMLADNNHFEESFAQAMILLFKDENKKQEIINKGQVFAQQLNAKQMIEDVWEIVVSK